MLAWQAELLRLSVFSKAQVKVADADWQCITGQEEADTRTQVPGGRALVGPALDGQLSLAATGNRYDCFLSPPRQDNPPEDDFPSVGAWPGVATKFFDATVPWLQQLQVPIIRIAFGSVLFSKQKGRDEAYTTLDELLDSVYLTPEHHDVIFRVNWPLESQTIEGLRINRITAWSVIKLTVRTLVLTDPANLAITAAPSAFAVRLEIDHNTNQEWLEPFDRAKVVPIYEELLKLAFENAEQGERP
jgi:hypothetical protein